MAKSITQPKKEIEELIRTSGLNFLLSIQNGKISSNGRSIHLPGLVQILSPIIGTSALLCAFKNAGQARDAFNKFTADQRLLPGHVPGVRLVEFSPMDHVRFKGGSYSTTFAQYDSNHWKVVKQCKAYGHPDKDLRLCAEMESIADLPSAAQNLFPAILDRDISKSMIRFDIEYVPYYNFAEIVRDGDFSTEQLSLLLTDMYDRLFKVLYKPRGNTGDQKEPAHYVEIIPERFNEVKDGLSKDNMLHKFIEAKTVIINGTPYPGLQATLQKAKDFLRNKRIPDTYNHGDLILQDILIDPASGDFKLVDGNGYSSGYMYDISKTLLCLQTKYDLFYDGDFTLDIADGTKLEATINFTNPNHVEKLEAMNTSFWEYLAANEDQFFADMPEWRKILSTLCGLQNIAIVMFHTLHHQKHGRACAFLLSGIKLINDSL